jgi:hypothetical protein
VNRVRHNEVVGLIVITEMFLSWLRVTEDAGYFASLTTDYWQLFYGLAARSRSTRAARARLGLRGVPNVLLPVDGRSTGRNG